VIKKIISGGQSGADIGGLKAAKEFGIETCGTMPKGFITEDGNKPEYAELYNIKESSSPKYPPRTEKNVKDSDGTIRLAFNFQSAGERCTLKFIKKHNKPYFDIDVLNPPPIEDVVKWLQDNNIETLNIAGNAEKKCPGIEEFVKEYLLDIFRQDCL